jgi:hypothetical protein
MRDVILNASRAVAYQGGCFVLNAAGTVDEAVIQRVARDDEDRAWLHDERNVGGSCIVAPGGELLAGQAGAEETILIAELDLDLAVAKRSIHDFAGHYNRADLLGLVVHPSPHALFRAPWQKTRSPSAAENRSELNAIDATHTCGQAREEAAATDEEARVPIRRCRQPS